MIHRTVRIALSVTSGASLGAYEAGAVAGLVVVLQRLNERSHRRGSPPPVVLDAVHLLADHPGRHAPACDSACGSACGSAALSTAATMFW